jgi:hypothetical protein
MVVPKGEERGKGKGNSLKNNGWKHPKFNERHKYKHPGSSINSK